MRKLTAMFVATTLALGAAGLAHAEPADAGKAPEGRTQGMMKHGPRGDMMFKNLNLTDAQKQQIRQIMQDSRKEPRMPSPEDRRALHQLITAGTFDRAQAETLVTKMEEANKARTLAHLEAQSKIYNILTPEQKTQYNANFEKRLAQPHPDKHDGKPPKPAE
ncbi:ATP-independent periplasmic protein-refolding chaperone [Affinibrenneria salicis]|uniref:ATP-independent periplasmic protein-refolding chaperone n=1 Tax=Affinibrenneria salicis TaxID=2590031 RepID=A0A5J5G696_9GAMM|nr:ATP-independent periplasmic protein-refolding chaperone Spy [Affinibrenneria salicis]KAA9002820.1 ATP-independent periplasmic protein-refolding chaperone [Affinibrenneria salicis]KAA9002893.1 ATP-independent periplasmic protein-refolding chaperone [Affinibrenneria salicis]